jgi:hypothetical protein
MNIQEALKETGKAHDKDSDDNEYVFVDPYGVLRWYDMVNKKECAAAELNEILSSGWNPYHEVKEIRPEKAGELWKRHDEYSLYYATYEYQHKEGIKAICLNDGMQYSMDKPFFGKMIHNKNGWTRLYPPIEDDSIERIETLIHHGCIKSGNGSNVIDIHLILPNKDDKIKFLNKPHIRAIFEIPKDKP